MIEGEQQPGTPLKNVRQAVPQDGRGGGLIIGALAKSLVQVMSKKAVGGGVSDADCEEFFGCHIPLK